MFKIVSKEEFTEKLNTKFPKEGPTIEILEYERSKMPATYRCKICGHTETIYCAGDLLKKKHLCNNCWYSRGSSESRKKKKDEALKKIEAYSNLTFIKFGWNARCKKETIKYSCSDCGLISEKQVESFLKNPICQGCSIGGKQLTTKGIQKLFPNGYTILEDYKGTETKVLVRHEDCGFIWKVAPHDIRSGYGCPKCSKKISKGERKILQWCEDNNIIFEREKKFLWAGQKRYDFFLPDFNLVIEYMGKQHYIDQPFFQRTLEEQKNIDKWKKQKALENGLDYLEIPYTDFDILENILAQRLSRKESREATPETKGILNIKDEDIV